MPSFTLDAAVHLIQVALTPVFLLSGIAALLNVYASRLARVGDRLDSLTAVPIGEGAPGEQAREEIARLRQRLVVLDVSLVLATSGAAATCLAILTLFLLEISNQAIAGLLLAFFGLAVVCTLISVATFGIEMLISSRALRIRMRFHLPLLGRGGRGQS